MVWEPTESADVVSAAELPLNATAEPISVPPSLNCTVPVGEVPETAAVKVKLSPTVEGLVPAVRKSDVEVEAAVTVKAPFT